MEKGQNQSSSQLKQNVSPNHSAYFNDLCFFAAYFTGNNEYTPASLWLRKDITPSRVHPGTAGLQQMQPTNDYSWHGQ